jgi:selenocysteine-specific elongation factor
MSDEASVKHFILATAGHVDHGKTALVHALTGVDTDRLPEEKARGITIDLGFAHLALPGFSIGLIDVPGHEDFVRNMVAGVGAVDLALLAVASDDGWMPQTEEHLQILAHLGANRAVIALTKSDLGGVEERAMEIRARLRQSPFAGAPIIATSVRTEDGIDELRAVLANEFAQLPGPRDFGKPRLFVDRVFKIRGSGTVVTGTLSGGSFARGDEVTVQPQALNARIRAMQSHNQPLECAEPRRRLALNLADLSPEQLARGMVIGAARNCTRTSRMIDVLLKRSSRLPIGTRPLANGALVHFHFGSARVSARVQLRDRKDFLPNDETIARLRLATPIAAFVGDCFILRDSSERQTIAGGRVLDPTPDLEKFRSTRQRALLEHRAAAPDHLLTLLQTQMDRDRFVPRANLLTNSPFAQREIDTALEELAASGRIFLDGKIAANLAWWKSVCESAATSIDAEHTSHPERQGLGINRLRDSLHLANEDLFSALIRVLSRQGYRQEGTSIRRESFRSSLPAHLQGAGDYIRALLRARPLDPPGRKELSKEPAATQALRFLCETGELVAVSDDVVMTADSVANMKAAIEKQLHLTKNATVSELRQATGTTRRVLVPLLEYFDRIGLTMRKGDRRSLR